MNLSCTSSSSSVSTDCTWYYVVTVNNHHVFAKLNTYTTLIITKANKLFNSTNGFFSIDDETQDMIT